MLVLKGCRKCQGDMYVERGVGVADLVCLQCGYRWPVRLSALQQAPVTSSTKIA
jgi:hypothetical protein